MGRALSTMERVAPSVTKRTRPVAAVLAVIAAAALIAVACGVHYNRAAVSELLSPLQVGRYAVRAERQSGDYDSKAERQIAFATDSDNAATRSVNWLRRRRSALASLRTSLLTSSLASIRSSRQAVTR